MQETSPPEEVTSTTEETPAPDEEEETVVAEEIAGTEATLANPEEAIPLYRRLCESKRAISILIHEYLDGTLTPKLLAAGVSQADADQLIFETKEAMNTPVCEALCEEMFKGNAEAIANCKATRCDP